MKSAIAQEKGIIETLHIINQDLSLDTKPLLQGHWVDGGIRGLIAEILIEADAVFSAGAHETELSQIVIASALTPQQIMDRAEEKFTAGTTRYPFSTIATYLAHYMLKAGEVVKVEGDALGPRKGKQKTKPRKAKYYLVDTK